MDYPNNRLQDRERSIFNWKNTTRIALTDTVQFIHTKCGTPLQVSIILQDMYGDDEYDYYLHFETRCIHCKGHKRFFARWRKSYINKNIKMIGTKGKRQEVYLDCSDHVEGIHGIEKGNRNCVYLLDRDGKSIGKLIINEKASKNALKRIKKYDLWRIARHAFYEELLKIRAKHIFFYWLEESQKHKLTQMIHEDYNALHREFP